MPAPNVRATTTSAVASYQSMEVTRRPRLASDREADPTAAAGLGVGVFHPELGGGQFVGEVDLRAVQQGQGDDVHQRRGAVALHFQVVCFGGVDQIELVLEAGAAAALARR